MTTNTRRLGTRGSQRCRHNRGHSQGLAFLPPCQIFLGTAETAISIAALKALCNSAIPKAALVTGRRAAQVAGAGRQGTAAIPQRPLMRASICWARPPPSGAAARRASSGTT